MKRLILVTCILGSIAIQETLFAASPTSFAIGQIPPCTAYEGLTNQFFIRSDLLGSTAVLSFTAAPAPVGMISLDQTTGLFTYVADAADRAPFTVRFSASAGGTSDSQNVSVRPLPHLLDEQSLVRLLANPVLPHADSTDYLILDVALSATDEEFNYIRTKTRTIRIIGNEIRFEAGNPNHLVEDYNNQLDIKSLHIFADVLVIGEALQFPGTDISIYARKIVFLDGAAASINTNPRELTNRPLPAVNGNPGQDGQHGLRAGNIEIYAGEIVASPGTIRFVAHGGNGQPGGFGLDGVQGRDSTEIDQHHLAGISRNCDHGDSDFNNPITVNGGNFTGCSVPDGTIYLEVICPSGSSHNCYGTCRFPDPALVVLPGNGSDAVRGGVPGNGGPGGSLTASLDISATADLHGGTAGPLTPLALGGRPGLPSPAYFTQSIRQTSGSWVCNVIGVFPTTAGRDAPTPPPVISVGSSGQFSQVGGVISWLNPYSTRMVLAYAKDACLRGFYTNARPVLVEYSTLLTNAYSARAWGSLPDEWRAELVQMQQEMDTLVHRIDSNLDYYGNPAGWTPMLTLEANLQAYQNEIDRAINVLYLVYWVGNSAGNIQEKISAFSSARQRLSEETESFQAEYNSTINVLGPLQQEAASILMDIDDLQRRIQLVEQELLDRAEHEVSERHKVPEWRKVSGIAGAVLTALPVYQPVLGAVGTGLTLLSQIDTHNPGQTFEQIGQLESQFSKEKLDQSANYFKSEMEKLDFANYLHDHTLTAGEAIAYVKNLESVVKPIAEGVANIQQILKPAEVPQSEIEALFGELKASDPLFDDLTKDLAELNARKEIFSQQLASALQSTATLTDGILNNLIEIDGFNQEIGRGDAVLDVRTLTYLKDMENRAKERLLRYGYYVAKAYVHRILEPYPGEIDLNPLFDRMRDIASAATQHDLSAEDFNALKAIYEDQIGTVVDSIVSLYENNRPSFSAPITYRLPKSLLDQLNQGESVELDLAQIGLIPLWQENVRLIDITPVMTVHQAAGTLGSRAIVEVTAQHSGTAIIRKDGQQFLFRYYNDGTVNPIEYAVRYDAISQQFNTVKPSPSDESLLRSLLGRHGSDPSSESLDLFATPGAQGKIVLAKSLDADTDIDLEITQLDLRFTFEYRKTRSDRVTIDVGVSEPYFAPRFLVDQTDLAGRGDIQGNGIRTFAKSQLVHLKVEREYGQYSFLKWTDGHGGKINGINETNSELSFTASRDQTFRAVYRPTEAASADTNSPIVQIISPSEGTITTNGSVTITGRASDNNNVTEVKCEIGTNDFVTANGTTNWWFTVALSPGTNIVSAVSIDGSGNQSKIATRHIFYAVSQVLQVQIPEPGGTITPPLNGQTLQIGRAYTVTATPNPGYVFSHWSGSVNSTKPVLQFIMSSNFVLQAHFIPNPFHRSSWTGLFASQSGVTRESSGQITLRTGDDGSFQGAISLMGGNLPFRGRLNMDGTSTCTVPRSKGTSLELNLTLNNDESTMYGTLSGGTWSSDILGDCAIFNQSNPCPFAGLYTVALVPDNDDDVNHLGCSFATVSVNSMGIATMLWHLSDGTQSLIRAPISPEGNIPLYADLYCGNGELIGWIMCTNLHDSVSGSVSWLKLPTTGKPIYDAGLSQHSIAVGSFIDGSSSLMTWMDGTMTLSGGGLPSTIIADISTGHDSTVRLNTKTGMFRGVIKNPFTDKNLVIQGVVLPKSDRGLGYFIGTSARTNSGSVTFEHH